MPGEWRHWAASPPRSLMHSRWCTCETQVNILFKVFTLEIVFVPKSDFSSLPEKASCTLYQYRAEIGYILEVHQVKLVLRFLLTQHREIWQNIWRFELQSVMGYKYSWLANWNWLKSTQKPHTSVGVLIDGIGNHNSCEGRNVRTIVCWEKFNELT